MGTFALLSAAQHVLDSISSGGEIDRERLGVMLRAADAEPKTYIRFEEDGTIVYVEDGVEVDREAPSADYTARQQALEVSRQKVSDFLTAKVPQYIEALDMELRSNNDNDCAALEIKVYRGTRHEGMSLNELELKALEEVKSHFRRHGYKTQEEHKKVAASADDSEPDYTLHTLNILQSSE
jgi:hypothetical protein